MQAITPVNVHVENEYREGINGKKNTKILNNKNRQKPQIRTRVINKTKKNELLSYNIPKQVVFPKLISPIPSRSSSPNRGPWVPPPGRATKGSKLSWQNPKARLEINPVTEISINDYDDDIDGSFNVEHNRKNTSLNSQTNTFSTEENEKLMRDIQIYEQRIQGLIDGIGTLKQRMHKHANQEETDQLRSDIDSSLLELERLHQDYTQHVINRTPRMSRSQSVSPIRSTPNNANNNKNRSSSADEPRQKRPTTSKVSFQDDPIIEKRRARSITPIKGPLHLNPDREQLLISLTESESDISQITKQLSSVKDILTKLKFDDQGVSFEVEQLYQHRNELLRLIEQFERSNSKLKEYLHHQYHLEAEHGLFYDKYDNLTINIHELEHENDHIRRLLLERENDNIALQTELERIKTQSIGFDTMKTSLEHNRAHLQRELYAKEGEINRLQCALKSLERDLQRSRYQHNHTHRSIKRPLIYPTPTNSSPEKKTIERLQEELNNRDQEIHELKKKLYENKREPSDAINSEILFLRTKLEQAEHVANEYKAQLHTQTLKTSATSSRSHLSEIELEKIRTRLHKRIEELEPIPDLLKKEEQKNERLQQENNELRKRLNEQSNTSLIDRIKDNRNQFSSDDSIRNLQRKITSLEEQNEKLIKSLNTKDEELRNSQTRLSARTSQSTSDVKIRENTINSTRFVQTSTFDLEQQITRLRLEYTQLKREKDELERHCKSQLTELREKLEHSNNTNRTMQNYINSLKTSYATIFNDTLPSSLARYTTT